MSEIKKRKFSHIRTCLEYDVQARNKTAGFEDIHLVHQALPDFSLDDIDISISFFNKILSAPIIIEAMTGGTEEAAIINAQLAKTADSLNIAMGVGSQRAAIENSDLAYTYEIARENAPTAFLIANLGVSQFVSDYSILEAREAIKMINADALAIHLNPLQEAVQPNGDTIFTGAYNKISDLVPQIHVPVIAKETGSGISAELAIKLEKAGFAGIDVGGAGGTSFAGVEALRAKDSSHHYHAELGTVFWDWGIPTVPSIFEVKNSTSLTLIASGGIRSGIDIAKAIALGAEVTGIAFPLLKPAMKSAESVSERVKDFIGQLKTAMFLTGAKDLLELKNKPVVITGKTREWLLSRGFKLAKYEGRLN